MTCPVRVHVSDHACERAAERLHLTPTEVRAHAVTVWAEPRYMPPATGILAKYVASQTRIRGNVARVDGKHVWLFFETSRGPFLATILVLPRHLWLEQLRHQVESGRAEQGAHRG